jgi:hypothetical protein
MVLMKNRIQFSTNLQRMVRLIEQFCVGLNGKGKYCLQKTGNQCSYVQNPNFQYFITRFL